MIRIQLPDAEVEALEQVLRTTADAKLRHRVQILLMAHRGRPHPAIAADTGTTPRSVQRWLNAYLDGGLDRLRPRKAKGAAPKLTPDLAPGAVQEQLPTLPLARLRSLDKIPSKVGRSTWMAPKAKLEAVLGRLLSSGVMPPST
jgi:hypothetical protein